MVNDPIADFITRIKNASAIGKASVTIPYSNVKMEIANVLLKEGYLASVAKRGRKVKKYIEAGLKYENNTPRVQGVKRLSKPSRRRYVGVGDLKPVRQGHGLLILSTPQGILTGKAAQKAQVGGEALFEIW